MKRSGFVGWSWWLRVLARTAARVGFLDAKRDYPSERDFIEMPLHGAPHAPSSVADELVQPAKIGEAK